MKVKSKSTSSSSKTTAKTTTSVKVKEKKVYTLPGQKHDPPEEVLQPLQFFLPHYFKCVYGLETPLNPLDYLFLFDRENH